MTARGPSVAVASVLAGASLLTSGCAGSAAVDPGRGEASHSPVILPVGGAESKKPLTVGSRNYPEQLILGEIYSRALAAAGFKARTRPGIASPQLAYRALRRGRIDGYPEYTGISLSTLFGVPTRDVPKERGRAYRQARADYARVGITALAPTPFENSYRLGALRETADRLGQIATTSQLARKAGTLTATTYPECAERKDCALGLERAYGTKFRRTVKSEDPYGLLDRKQADVAFVFTTDAEITKGRYTLLQDDRHFFPPYNVSFGIRDEALRRIGPEGREIIERVQRPLTTDVMREYDSRVVLDGQKPAKVAADYLKEAGFVR